MSIVIAPPAPPATAGTLIEKELSSAKPFKSSLSSSLVGLVAVITALAPKTFPVTRGVCGVAESVSEVTESTTT